MFSQTLFLGTLLCILARWLWRQGGSQQQFLTLLQLASSEAAAGKFQVWSWPFLVIQVGFAQSAALKKLANRNVFRQHRSFSFRSRFCTNIFFTFWYIFVPGVPPEPSQGCQSEAQWWQVCPDPLFHRFFVVFGIHFGRRFLTCCSV